MSQKYSNLIAICFLITLLINQFVGTPFIATTSVGLFIFAFVLFVDRLCYTLPFRELAILVTVLQLLLSSYLAFYIQAPDPTFAPKGNPDDYFNYAIPGVICFSLGLFTFKPQLAFPTNLREHLKNLNLFILGKIFIQAGYLALLGSMVAPGSIQYFLVLISFLTYIGGFIVLFSEIPKISKFYWIFLSFLPVLTTALSEGVFFMAMIWIVYLFMFYMLLYPHKWGRKFIWMILGLYILIVVDTAKTDYRSLNDSYLSHSANKIENLNAYTRAALFASILWEKMTFQTLFSDDNLSGRVTRANQGALVTWVMAYTPSSQPYGEGETIWTALTAAIFPRFLLPTKAIAGGKANFEKYTGQMLNNSTSINISLLGEGWANFGYIGGIIFMYCVGCFYSLLFYFFAKAINAYPVYFFFIPFLFIYTIKAEDDLLTPLNHIVKASIVLYILHFIFIKRTIRKALIDFD